MTAAIATASLSALCFGVALVTGRIGLRTLDPRAGAAISIPTATALFALAAPFAFDAEGFSLRAALLFALVGLFFPAIVTLLTFRSNERLGPTVTGAVSGTAPLFALLAAGLFLGEKVPVQAAVACVGILVGIALLSLREGSVRPGFLGWSLLWPLSGALIRGLAQAGAKAGLLLWPNPFAASLIGYSVSSAAILGANQFRRSKKPQAAKHGIAWFAVTGVLNGAAVLLMYAALSLAPVSLVAPVVATYPLVTALTSAVVLREEPLTLRMMAGATIAVLAIVYLVGSTGQP
ncbi:MAG: DMT family transporter [Betaproteobacteria bacterium]|nr:DMT family transporter [Betaproteobacteria bacterium]